MRYLAIAMPFTRVSSTARERQLDTYQQEHAVYAITHTLSAKRLRL